MDVGTGLETRLKEILYRCLEEIQATKAALYLLQEDGTFQVATQYGFKNGLRHRVVVKDQIVDNLLVKRNAYTLNSLVEDTRFSEFLYQADTSKILVAPIYSRARLAGFLDMRDKAGGRDFEPADLARASEICDSFLGVFRERGMYGQRKIPLGAASSKPRASGERESLPTPGIVEEAFAEITRGVLLEEPPVSSGMEVKLGAVIDALPAFLGMRSVSMIAASIFSETGGEQVVMGNGKVSKEALEKFQKKLQSWLQRDGEDVPHLKTRVEYPLGTPEPEVTAERIRNLVAAPVRAAEPHTMILSAVFDQRPGDATRRQLERLHKGVEKIVESATAAAALGRLRERVAMNLLEPDLQGYPDLILHARRVASLALELATKIGMSSGEQEDVRLAALVHDVGLRLLGYRQIQRKEELPEAVRHIVRNHPVVGAAIVARSALGSNVARMVYSHHERIDGTGYPEGIRGDRIPVGARIIHICEAYDAMTSEHSYKSSIDRWDALERIRSAAGSQFDADLAETFCTMVENS